MQKKFAMLLTLAVSLSGKAANRDIQEPPKFYVSLGSSNEKILLDPKWLCPALIQDIISKLAKPFEEERALKNLDQKKDPIHQEYIKQQKIDQNINENSIKEQDLFNPYKNNFLKAEEPNVQQAPMQTEIKSLLFLTKAIIEEQKIQEKEEEKQIKENIVFGIDHFPYDPKYYLSDKSEFIRGLYMLTYIEHAIELLSTSYINYNNSYLKELQKLQNTCLKGLLAQEQERCKS